MNDALTQQRYGESLNPSNQNKGLWKEQNVCINNRCILLFSLCASIEVRKAAAQCVKNILATQSGVDFWEQHKDNRDPMLAYLNPFRKAKKKVG